MKPDRIKKLKVNYNSGATLLEYAIVIVFLGFVAYFASLQFAPKSSQFYSQSTPGLNKEYPTGFVVTPSS